MLEDSPPACIVARLTSPGRGAVAVISVEGVNAVECVAKHFVSAAGKPLSWFPIDRIIFGRWMQADGNGEEIVVCRTSENSLEVNCHGGVAAARAIMNALVLDGAIEQAPVSWATRHSGDSIEAEAWLALGEARTERTAAILLDQYRGALREALESTIAELESGHSTAARQRLAMLLERGDIGRHLTKPWRVAFAGPPNVGKSSLMNCLLGYQRSIVFDQPGTTRDLLSAPTAIDGWSLELTDTAGLRDSEDLVEVEGVSRATHFLAEADLTVLVFDATRDWDAHHEKLRTSNPQALMVFNKCDLQDAPPVDTNFVATSALTGAGVAGLAQQIEKRLACCDLAAGDAVPFTTRQIQVIDAACGAIDDGQVSVAIDALKGLIIGGEAPLEGLDTPQAVLPHPHIGWAVLWMFAFWAVQIGVSVVVAIVAVALAVAQGTASSQQVEQAMASVSVVMIPIGTLFSVITAIVIAFIFYRRQFSVRLGLRGMTGLQYLASLLAVLPLAVIASEITNYAGEFLPSFNTEVLGQFAASPWPIVFVAACLFPAIGEEIFCRGFLGRGLVAHHGVVGGVLLASLLFGIMHIDPVQSVGAFVLGLGLHFIYLTTRSLLAPMLVHMLNNAFAFWVMRNYEWCPLPGLSPLPDGSQVHTPPSVVFAAITAAITVLGLLYQTRTSWLLTTSESNGEKKQAWTPGYVTAEQPPREIECRATTSRPQLWLVAMVVLSYGALLVALAIESESVRG